MKIKPIMDIVVFLACLLGMTYGYWWNKIDIMLMVIFIYLVHFCSGRLEK